MKWPSVEVTCSLYDSIAPLIGIVETFNKAIASFEYTNWSSVDIFRLLYDSIAPSVGTVEALDKAIASFEYTKWPLVDIFRPLDDPIAPLDDIIAVRKYTELTSQVYLKKTDS